MGIKIPSALRGQVIFVGSSAFCALLTSQDPQHSRAESLFNELARDRWRLVTTNMVVAETYNRLRDELGSTFAGKWLEAARELNVERVSEIDEDVAEQILKQNPQKNYGYSEAANFAVMLRLGIDQCLDFSNSYSEFGFFPYGEAPQIFIASTAEQRKRKKMSKQARVD